MCRGGFDDGFAEHEESKEDFEFALTCKRLSALQKSGPLLLVGDAGWQTNMAAMAHSTQTGRGKLVRSGW